MAKIKVILTDAMDVLFCCFTNLPFLLSFYSSVPEELMEYRIGEELENLWELCRGNTSEVEYWREFTDEFIWINENGYIVKVEPEILLRAFRNNMRYRVPGTFEIYKRLVNESGMQLFLASDHYKEAVPLLISWHPEVFKAIPEEKRYWSCDLGMVKGDPGFFPFVLNEMKEKFGIRSDEILFIDDNIFNILAARLNGIRSIHFESAEQLEADLRELGLL